MSREIKPRRKPSDNSATIEDKMLGFGTMNPSERALFLAVIQGTIPLINNVSSIGEITKKELLFRSQVKASIDLAHMFVDVYRETCEALEAMSE